MTAIKNVDSDKQSKVGSIILEKRGKITFFIITILSNFLLKYSENCAYDVNFFFSKKSAKLNIADISL